METDEKWPSKTFKDKEYMVGPDNGCFYRYASMKLGVCVGPVNQEDRLGNKFCHHHIKLVKKQDRKESKKVS
jgi:S-adenosylmethionine hydrolase